MKYKETNEDIVITGNKYYRPSKVTFYIPQDGDILFEAQEVMVRESGESTVEEFSRNLSFTMLPEDANTTFMMYNRQGNEMQEIRYKDMFFAVESFYQHLAEKADAVIEEV